MPSSQRSFWIVLNLLLLSTGISCGDGSADSSMAEHEHMNHHGAAADMNMDMDMDEHAAHRAALGQTGYSVTTVRYDVPDVELIDEAGRPVALKTLFETDQPVALNFIFTTCTTICPVMTATFAQMRRDLGQAADRVRLVSITIDPEYDRPEVLEKYAERFATGAGWTFLTGDGSDISRVLESFHAYAGSKMNHQPITFLKGPGSLSWIRIDGLASGDDLAREVETRILGRG